MSLKFTWFGAACILMESEEHSVLFDPFFENIPANFDSRNLFSHIDKIFITHGHFDHIAFNQELLEVSDAGIRVPSGVKKNIMRWCQTKNKNRVYRPFTFRKTDVEHSSEKLASRINKIQKNEIIDISDKVSVFPFRSNHVRYDTAIFRDKLSVFSNYKYIPSAIKLALHYMKKQVLGYRVTFDDKKIVTFGSMPHRITREMQGMGPLDVLFVPMAGKKAKNLVVPALRLIDAFQPKIVIPNHQNDFFPPLSDDTDVGLLREELGRQYPEIKFFEPVLGEHFQI